AADPDKLVPIADTGGNDVDEDLACSRRRKLIHLEDLDGRPEYRDPCRSHTSQCILLSRVMRRASRGTSSRGVRRAGAMTWLRQRQANGLAHRCRTRPSSHCVRSGTPTALDACERPAGAPGGPRGGWLPRTSPGSGPPPATRNLVVAQGERLARCRRMDARDAHRTNGPVQAI